MLAHARRHVSRFAGTLAIGALALSAPALRAQERPPSDSGYAKYWPGACLEAVDRSDAYYWRSRIDTTRYMIERDTMISASVLVAKECVATFTIDSVKPRDLVLLARLYLAVGNDTLANAAIARRMETLEEDDSARASVLRDVVTAYVSAKPSRLAEGQAYLQQLDMLTSPIAARYQLLAHQIMIREANLRRDESAAANEAMAVIQAGRRLAPNDRGEQSTAIFIGYATLAQIAADSGHPEPVHAIMAEARSDLGQLGIVNRVIQNTDSSAAFLTRRAQRVQANIWIGAPGDTIHPKPGKVSLIVMGPSRVNIPAIRRVARLVPDTVDVTFVYTTYGHFRGKGPLQPTEEVDSVRKFFRGELAAPGTIAVSTPRFTVLADGRKFPIPTRNDLLYGSRVGVSILLVDRMGIIRRVYGGWDPTVELRIEGALQALENSAPENEGPTAVPTYPPSAQPATEPAVPTTGEPAPATAEPVPDGEIRAF